VHFSEPGLRAPVLLTFEEILSSHLVELDQVGDGRTCSLGEHADIRLSSGSLEEEGSPYPLAVVAERPEI
tara:strand:- start:109 stop:318 length:210 start_codon:yes stop_codon:yes gene_type:complete